MAIEARKPQDSVGVVLYVKRSLTELFLGDGNVLYFSFR